MAEINLGKDETINATLSNVDTIQANVSTEENINANVYDVNYIPGYVVAEQERRANEAVRQANEADRIALYNDMEYKLETDYFKGEKGDKGDPGTTDHTLLTHLDYESSGHTGFASKDDVEITIAGETFYTNQEFASFLLESLQSAFEDVWGDLSNKYQKPSSGIPRSDLDTYVQTSLNKADTALQEHQDISGKQNIQENTLTTTNKTIPSAINEVNSIAKGANQALSYNNYSSMVTAINALSSTALNVGQNIMIVTVEVPDLWVSGIESTSSTYTYVDDATIINDLVTNGYIQVGYYKLSMLETQKVDLTNYITNTDYATTNGDAGIVKVGASYGTTISNTGYLGAYNMDNTQYGAAGNGAIVGKGTLETVLANKGYLSASNMDSALNSSSTNPVKNSALYKAVVGEEITFQIPLSAWSEPSGTNFYNTVAIVTLPANTFTDNCTLELLNYEGFQYFAKHGFVLYGYEVSSQRIWITAHDKPTSYLYLKMMVYNYE